jgi:diguanylate cyclase (GGDEF)-like protein
VKRILAFESDQELVTGLAEAFAEQGYALEVVDDADVGLERVAAERPDAILLAIELPHTNGFSVCNKLKRNRKLRDIPLVIMSSECSEETFREHRTMQTRAEGYLHKPFEPQALIDLVQRVLEAGTVRALPPPVIIEAPSAASRSPGGTRRKKLEAALEGGRPAGARHSKAPPPLEQCLLGLRSPDSRIRGQLLVAPHSGAGGETKAVVGRDLRNAVAIDDPALAEEHFRLERTTNGVYVRDLGSGRPTLVNDEPVARERLFGGEVIEVGDTILLYVGGVDPAACYEAVVRELVERDPATRTLTRQAFRERLEIEVLLADQERVPLSLVALAIDDLPQIASGFDDRVVDHVFRVTASLIRKTARTLLAGRDRDDGFLVALPGATIVDAVALAEGWRAEAAALEIPVDVLKASFAVSAGVVQLQRGWTATELLRRAHGLQWEARTAGGNRVVSGIDRKAP